MNITEISTPYILLDLPKARENIKTMQAGADRYGCALRPHIKTHKSIEIAKMQLAAGAAGITSAKPSEAAVFAEEGIDDIFIAYPLIGNFRIQRAIALFRNVKRLILGIDSLEGAKALSNAAVKEGVILEIRLEIDTGLKRTGIPRENAASLAKEIVQMPGLDLTGIYTYKGLLLDGTVTNENQLAGEEEARLIEDTVNEIDQIRK